MSATPLIVETIDVAAPPSRVFRALTTPDELVEWWGDPAVCGAVHWELEPRAGGVWRSRWRWTADGTEFDIHGEVLTFEPPSLIVYSWRDDRYPDVVITTVRYDIEPTADGCRVRVTHSGFAAETADYMDYRGGWSSVLRGLKRGSEQGALV